MTPRYSDTTMLLKTLPSFFKQRRENLQKKASKQNAAFVFFAAPEVLRNPDVTYPYRQESNFYYLTGFEEPEALALVLPNKYVLFVRKRDPHMEMWEGERYGTEGALKVFGADEAYLIDELDTKLPELLKTVDQIYYRAHHSEHDDRILFNILEKVRKSMGRSGRPLLPIHDPNEVLGEMRLFKSAEEADLMRKACKITALTHKTVMQQTRVGMNEFEVEALIDYEFRRNGCARVGYGSIVAGGKNATCLHYRSNNEVLKDGDLLLIDAGGEYGYYTSDITRTFSVGKKFSKAQAAIYDLVLKSQLECIAMAKPGATMAGIHKHACTVLTEGLLSLGLLQGKLEQIVESGGFRRFYPHGTGHWLGMDVHDIGLYQLNGEPRKLEAGMMFTIEPGLYVQPDDKDAPAEYRDIGVRIEDDILITSNGCEVMTSAAPKKRDEIEALRT